MPDTIKPIETFYKGYRFRSRLEARWAVFFDAMGIEWEYEKEGFALDDGKFYLPDFYLPKEDVLGKKGIWVEVKPGRFAELDGEKFQGFARHFPIIAAVGVPEPKYYDGLTWSDSVADDDASYWLAKGGFPQWQFNEKHGIHLPDLIGFRYSPHRFGEYRASEYLYKATAVINGRYDFEKKSRALEGKWRQALTHACNTAKQARFEFGESG